VVRLWVNPHFRAESGGNPRLLADGWENYLAIRKLRISAGFILPLARSVYQTNVPDFKPSSGRMIPKEIPIDVAQLSTADGREA
jgi:hypothetical protein